MPDGFSDLDFHDFHRVELPRRLARGNGALAAVDARDLEPLAFQLPGGAAYTYVPREDGLDVIPGDERAHTVIELDAASWQGLVHELETPPGLLYASRARSRRGNAMYFVRWDPALRAMYTGRPIFDPATARLEDRDGRPLDPRRAFAPDEDAEDMAHFLRTAGYLHVRGLFSPDEIERFRARAEQARREAVKGDRESWWGKNARGEEVLCRVTNAGRFPDLRPLPRDPRITRLVGLSDWDLSTRERGADREVSIIFKNPDMCEGLSDLPWHRDCGMGGHAVMCPVLIVSTFLYEGTPETGELRFLPGSWRGACPFIDARDEAAPEGAGIHTRPGDVTLHYGDLMHAAPPPTGPGPYRVSVTTGYTRPGVRHHRGERDYNDVLLGREDGQVEHLEAVARRS